MGRLDEAAKRKVVELRMAGLSFRKIKAVLELENIKVSAQAIYLFLREFQGRRPGRVRPPEAGGNATTAHVQNLVGGLQESWNSTRLQNLLRGASHHAGFTKHAKQASAEADGNAKASGCAEGGAESRLDQQQQQSADDNDVQIVSVTSLAQSRQRAETSATSSPGTASLAFARRRVTPSPATSSMLAARKRILDKALTHRMKVASLSRRDQANVQRADAAPMSQQQPPPSSSSAASTHYDLTADKTRLEDGEANTSRQRPGLLMRSPHSLPRSGVRLPNRPQATLASSAPGGPVIRMQTSGGPGPTQSAMAWGGLQDQIQTLGCEVRSLGLAVKMLAEQQNRLEREQVQQTHIQKQILSTLQSLASRAGPRGNARQGRNKTPSPSCLPVASSSFSQDSFDFSQVAFSQCSQNQATYDSLESLEPVEAFKLPVLNPEGMNGFPPCSASENLPLTHTPPQTQQPYTGAYPPQTCQTLLASYGQPYVPPYDRSHPQPFREAGSKTSDFESSCSGRGVQDCSMSTQDQNLNIIKVEGP